MFERKIEEAVKDNLQYNQRISEQIDAAAREAVANHFRRILRKDNHRPSYDDKRLWEQIESACGCAMRAEVVSVVGKMITERLAGEVFIDEIVNRINRKQLGRAK